MERNKKIVLVLGGGGARGLAHIGVLRVLKEKGIKPSIVIGSSIGAVIGAGFALGLSANELETEALRYKKRWTLTKFFDFTIPTTSLLRGKKINKYLNSFYSKAYFSDCQIPLRIITTDLETGKAVILKNGKVADAVQASIAVPGIFPPVKMNERWLIDGGVISPTPIDYARKYDPDLIIAVDLIMKRKIKILKPNILSTILLSYEIIRTQMVKDKLHAKKKNVVIIKPKMSSTIDSFKFSQIKEFILSGEEAAKKALIDL
ncbi:patatin-like phospholipase family protein [Candidatus Parcubacteria bacterium]|nr:patatin-like phospholipase family protein [Candidatus Parcubacteria bacterium]